jgi:hypothetical protein
VEILIFLFSQFFFNIFFTSLLVYLSYLKICNVICFLLALRSTFFFHSFEKTLTQLVVCEKY